jgi:hypothetical protein
MGGSCVEGIGTKGMGAYRHRGHLCKVAHCPQAKVLGTDAGRAKRGQSSSTPGTGKRLAREMTKT